MRGGGKSEILKKFGNIIRFYKILHGKSLKKMSCEGYTRNFCMFSHRLVSTESGITEHQRGSIQPSKSLLLHRLAKVHQKQTGVRQRAK